MPPNGPASNSALSTEKLSLPAYLKVFTNGGMKMADAMAVTKKLFPSANSPSQLAELTAVNLVQLQIEDKELRKLILTSIKKAGWIKSATTVKKSSGNDPSSSSSSAPVPSSNLSPKKRKRQSDLVQDPLTESIRNEEQFNDFEFNEILDEKALLAKSTHINRAPVMTAWAMVVAEHMGFKRTEALSISSVYTEMNAASKGVSLGLYEKNKNAEYESGSTQPTVEIMGRTIPLLSNENEEWRALVKGSPVEPSTPYGYLSRSFRQTLPAVVGAMRLLALSYTDPAELNKDGFHLYATFRPQVEGWGKRSEMRLSSILILRKESHPKPPLKEPAMAEGRGSVSDNTSFDQGQSSGYSLPLTTAGSPQKRPRNAGPTV